MKDVFAFAEHQEKATKRLSYNLTLKRNYDRAVLSQSAAAVKVKICLKDIITEWPIILQL